jgi:hypothetical protein
MSRMSAQHVSQSLRIGGLRPLPSGTPYTREGIRVKQQGQSVRISIDVDGGGSRRALADSIEELLTAARYVFSRDATPLDVGEVETFLVTGRTGSTEPA